MSNSLEGDFVHDDVEAVLRNPDVTGAMGAGGGHGHRAAAAAAVTDVFLNDFWGSPMSSNHSHKSYRPLTTLLFRYAQMNAASSSKLIWPAYVTDCNLNYERVLSWVSIAQRLDQTNVRPTRRTAWFGTPPFGLKHAQTSGLLQIKRTH